MSGPTLDPALLRVSDAERTHVLKLLETATGRGLIDLGEYTERSNAVIAARTRGQLNQVLLDLPGLQIAGRSVEEAARATRGGPRGPGFSGAPARWSPPNAPWYLPEAPWSRPEAPWSPPDGGGGGGSWEAGPADPEHGPAGPPPQVLELTGWGNRSLRGQWDVPPRIVIGGFGAATRLDFSEARLISRTVMIEFRSSLADSVLIIVPRGGGVRMDGLSMRGVRFRNKVPPTGRGGVELVLVGVKRIGAIAIRFPRPRWVTSLP